VQLGLELDQEILWLLVLGCVSKAMPSLVLLNMGLPVLLLTSSFIIDPVESEAMGGGRNNLVGMQE